MLAEGASVLGQAGIPAQVGKWAVLHGQGRAGGPEGEALSVGWRAIPECFLGELGLHCALNGQGTGHQ